MRYFIHDYAGHPFPPELSRELARRGAEVTHLFFAQDPGPKGALQRRTGDPDGLRFVPVGISRPYDKGSMIARRFSDVAYGRRVGALVRQERPDLVISGNTPTEAQQQIVTACRAAGSAFVYWLQDVYSIAATSILTRRLGPLGAMVGRYYQALERWQMRQAAGVVAITRDFVPLAAEWSGAAAKVRAIENWGPLSDIPVAARNNAWARAHDCTSDFVFLYSGTLGLKHNPGLIAALAERFAGRARVVVAGQGLSVPILRDLKAARHLDNLDIHGIQPISALPEMLASADALIAIIDKQAGVFSVPSKVLSYLCAAKPVLLAAPAENLATATVLDAEAGLVADPSDTELFLANAERVFADPELCARLGANGRSYAERAFDIGKLADRFEAAFAAALTHRSGRRAAVSTSTEPAE